MTFNDERRFLSGALRRVPTARGASAGADPTGPHPSLMCGMFGPGVRCGECESDECEAEAFRFSGPGPANACPLGTGRFAASGGRGRRYPRRAGSKRASRRGTESSGGWPRRGLSGSRRTSKAEMTPADAIVPSSGSCRAGAPPASWSVRRDRRAARGGKCSLSAQRRTDSLDRPGVQLGPEQGDRTGFHPCVDRRDPVAAETRDHPVGPRRGQEGADLAGGLPLLVRHLGHPVELAPPGHDLGHLRLGRDGRSRGLTRSP